MDPDTAIHALPTALAQWLKPGAVEHLRCFQLSDREFKIELLDEPMAEVPGPLAMLGYAKRFHPSDTVGTNEIMQLLREGDND